MIETGPCKWASQRIKQIQYLRVKSFSAHLYYAKHLYYAISSTTLKRTRMTMLEVCIGRIKFMLKLNGHVIFKYLGTKMCAKIELPPL